MRSSGFSAIVRVQLVVPIIVAGLLTVASITRAADRVPDGLSTPDWSSIRAAYEANRRSAFPAEDGYVARNPGQQWRTHFDGRGFETTPDHAGWSWGLELRSYGSAGAEQSLSAPQCADATGSRVEYHWNANLTEWYINDQRGMEHGYTVHARPSGNDALLRFSLAVRGELTPSVSDDGRNVTFVTDSGAAVVNYSGLKVFDAIGTEVPAWIELGSELSPFAIRHSSPSSSTMLRRFIPSPSTPSPSRPTSKPRIPRHPTRSASLWP